MSQDIAAKHWWNGTVVPMWIVAILLGVTTTLGAVVWNQQSSRIERLETAKVEADKEQIQRTQRIATLEANSENMARMIADVKDTQKDMLTELKNINHWLRGQKAQ